ncbi:histidinol-phosphate transaminase [Devriesea agamarum]|uniref:histidinol-phosphate transaminase n=1 Tax=Devriesea agamarum TaxID=472569 RepID=UPI000A01C409|nr:histidinol-phosphate transaminase [Devriesea agamarum]
MEPQSLSSPVSSALAEQEPSRREPTVEEHIRTRSCLDILPSYVPGKPAADDGKVRFKLSSNESPFPPLPAVREALLASIDGLNRYPDMTALPLRTVLAQRVGVDPSQVVVSTGSVAACADLVRALVDPGDEVIYAWRSFEAYPIIVGTHGGHSVQVPLTEDLSHDLEAMAAAVTSRTKLIILCTPNNPTGLALTAHQIEDFLAAVPDHVVVAIDEAYREFVNPEQRLDALDIFHRHSNVVLLRTFSKAHGIAGLRIGYAIAHPQLATALAKVTLPFGANALAQAGALACLDEDSEYLLEERAATLREERQRIEDELRAQGWNIPRSQGNFIYLPLAHSSAEFAAFADEQGLVVRAYGTDGVRITVAEPEANDRIIEACGLWLKTSR